jgi:hypothetical protein
MGDLHHASSRMQIVRSGFRGVAQFVTPETFFCTERSGRPQVKIDTVTRRHTAGGRGSPNCAAVLQALLIIAQAWSAFGRDSTSCVAGARESGPDAGGQPVR